METISSFQIDHLKLLRGLYLSKKYNIDGMVMTVFDLRMRRPYKDDVMGTGAIHAIEHIVATFLRNDDDFGNRIVYFGPMGCRTGFYLIIVGDLMPQDVLELLIRAFDYVVNFEGDIPGATPQQCGYCYDMNLDEAKLASNYYIKTLKDSKKENLNYPKNGAK